jgi:hypothetical protein
MGFAEETKKDRGLFGRLQDKLGQMIGAQADKKLVDPAYRQTSGDQASKNYQEGLAKSINRTGGDNSKSSFVNTMSSAALEGSVHETAGIQIGMSNEFSNNILKRDGTSINFHDIIAIRNTNYVDQRFEVIGDYLGVERRIPFGELRSLKFLNSGCRYSSYDKIVNSQWGTRKHVNDFGEIRVNRAGKSFVLTNARFPWQSSLFVEIDEEITGRKVEIKLEFQDIDLIAFK